MDISKFYFKSKPILSSLNPADSRYFFEHLKLSTVARGVELFKEGNSAKVVYILKRGKVKIYQESIELGDQMIYIYTPGEMFGFRPLLSDEKHFASAMTLEECELYTLGKKQFMHAVRNSIQLSNFLLQNLCHEFTVLINHISAFSQKSAKQRVALSLLIIQEKYRQPGIRQTQIRLSRGDLAAFAGTTNETLARIISRFREERIIKMNGRKIIINNAEALVQLSEF